MTTFNFKTNNNDKWRVDVDEIALQDCRKDFPNLSDSEIAKKLLKDNKEEAEKEITIEGIEDMKKRFPDWEEGEFVYKTAIEERNKMGLITKTYSFSITKIVPLK